MRLLSGQQVGAEHGGLSQNAIACVGIGQRHDLRARHLLHHGITFLVIAVMLLFVYRSVTTMLIMLVTVAVELAAALDEDTGQPRLAQRDDRFVQLGMGWVLRELSLADRDAVISFLKDHAPTIRREALRPKQK